MAPALIVVETREAQLGVNEDTVLMSADLSSTIELIVADELLLLVIRT